METPSQLKTVEVSTYLSYTSLASYISKTQNIDVDAKVTTVVVTALKLPEKYITIHYHIIENLPSYFQKNRFFLYLFAHAVLCN